VCPCASRFPKCRSAPPCPSFADADDEEAGYARPFYTNRSLTDLGDGQWHSAVSLFVPDVCPNFDGPWGLTFELPVPCGTPDAAADGTDEKAPRVAWTRGPW